MKTRITLTINDRVIYSAKKYAAENGKSISNIVETYLKSLTADNDLNNGLSPQVSKMMGVLNLSQEFDYKEELGSLLLEKHGRSPSR